MRARAVSAQTETLSSWNSAVLPGGGDPLDRDMSEEVGAHAVGNEYGMSYCNHQVVERVARWFHFMSFGDCPREIHQSALRCTVRARVKVCDETA